MALKTDAKCQGVFYSNDHTPFTTSSVKMGNVKKKVVTGSIITYDFIPDLEEDDFILYEGDLFIVKDISREDLTENKQYSTRPSYETIIELRR